MKILHCCLAQFYIDDYGYQENILPKMHKLQGHEVSILASTEVFVNNIALGYVKPSSYSTKEGIPITRLPYVSWLPHSLGKKLRIYPGVFDFLTKTRPDIIFIHDLQFLSILDIAKYAEQRKNLIIYVDGHTDFINSARNWISKYILHKIIYKYCAKRILPYTRKFYGVLPVRVDFFKNVYKLPEKKVELLVMGCDLEDIDFNKRNLIRTTIRQKHGLSNDDFVIITGGKIDYSKNVHLLIHAIHEIKNSRIKLIVFGKIEKSFEDSLMPFFESTEIIYAGWLSTNEISNYFLCGDLAFFPGSHSVLWEHSIALGLPGVFKEWEGMRHVDVGGNALFLSEVTVESIKSIVNRIYSDKILYTKMKDAAEKNGAKNFSYYEIAKRAIEVV